jgi:ankyrin repeat protein
MKTLSALMLFIGMSYLQASTSFTIPRPTTTRLINAIQQWIMWSSPEYYERVKDELARAKKFNLCDGTDNDGKTALDYALRVNCRDLTEVGTTQYDELLRSLIKATQIRKKNYLYSAVFHSNVEAIGLLLEAKAPLNLLSFLENTPLDRAIENIYMKNPLNPADYNDLEDKIVIAQTLLFAGAKTKLLDNKPHKFNYSRTPNVMHALATSGRIEILQTLARLGMYLHVKQSDDTTPLHEAGTAETVCFLISHGAHVHALTTRSQTPLHTAKNSAVALALLAHGANPNAKDFEGNTPLHTATYRNDLSVVQALLNYKPTHNAKESWV